MNTNSQQTPIDPPATKPPAVIEPPHSAPFVERRDPKPFETGAPISAIVPRNLDELARVAAAIIRAGMAPDSYIVVRPRKSRRSPRRKPASGPKRGS
jgi:hypothetical protein